MGAQKRYMLRPTLLTALLVLIGWSAPAAAQVNTTIIPTTDEAIVTQALLGDSTGVTVTEFQFIGSGEAVGTFLDGPFGMEQGLVISSGRVTDMAFQSPQTMASTDLGMPGHWLCDQMVSPAVSRDAAYLRLVFDIDAEYNGVSFDYVVGTNEYPDFVGQGYNDGFAIFVNGVNVALDPNNQPLTINGPFFSGPNVVTYPNTQSNFNGSTPLFTTHVDLTPGSTGNELVVVLCDAGDGVVDTGAFVSGLAGCSGDCVGTAYCGDGILQAGEECDLDEFDPAFADCPAGYTGSPMCNNDPNNPMGDGTCTVSEIPYGCTAINICEQLPGVCGEGTCIHTGPETYACDCNPGYQYDGTTCVPVNVCVEEPDVCGPGSCTYTGPGTYNCSCDAGHQFDGSTCVPVNVCVEEPDVCGPGSCTYTGPGTYDCSCDAGHQYDGTTCVPVNVCVEEPDICGAGSCLYTGPGTYGCDCDAGYQYDGVTCVEINVCVEEPDVCGPGSCAYTGPGTYDCSCDAGHQFDGTTCVPVNICVEEPDVCGPGSCVYTGPGSYDCACDADYTFDGETCVAVLVIDTPEEGEYTNNPRPTISGTGEPGATVIVSVDGDVVGSAEVDANGNWSFVPTSDIADGEVTISATDGVSDDQVTVNIDTVAPPIQIHNPADGEVFSLSPTVIEGESEPNAQVDVYIDGDHVGTTTADANGDWELELDEPLEDGVYLAVAVASDLAGNQSETSAGFIVDTTALVVIVAPVEGAVVRTAQPTVSGTAEPGAEVDIIIDGEVVGTVTADEEGQWSWQPEEEMADGQVTVTARTDSPAGDREDTVTFEIDTSTTDVLISSPEDGALLNNSRPVISGSAAPGATVTIFVDGEEAGTVVADGNGNWSFTPEESLEDGERTITAVADDDGIITDDSIEITIDTVPPSLVVYEPEDGASVDPETAYVTGSTEPGAEVEVFVDGEYVGSATAGEDGSFSIALPDDLEPGEYDLRVTATDEAGNTAVDERTFFVDAVEEFPLLEGYLSGGGIGLGCSATSPGEQGLLALLFGVLLLGLRRRRKS